MSTDTEGNPIYRIRGKDDQVRQITVPREVALLIPPETRFTFRLTETGFEYVLVKEIPERGLPDWVNELGRDQR